jgi:hypothetical protein
MEWGKENEHEHVQHNEKIVYINDSKCEPDNKPFMS